MTELTGRVLDASSPGWDAARHNFKAALDYGELVPRCVVFCQDAQDVCNAVRFARENNLPLRARAGRHSYEGYSLVNDGVIVDVSELDMIRVDAKAGTARLGAGVYCIDLHEQLYDVGVTIPAASGASVGFAGLALGGGFGVTSRKYGLTCDNVIGVELVNAKGELIYASPAKNPDLYWAHRGGGGGNFGIVTAFDVTVKPIGSRSATSPGSGRASWPSSTRSRSGGRPRPTTSPRSCGSRSATRTRTASSRCSDS